MVFLLIIGNIKSTWALDNFDCQNSLDVSINSNNFLSYLDDYQLKPTKICAGDYCEEVKYNNIEIAFNNFKNNYYNLLQHKLDGDKYLEATIKGFRIDKLEVNNCFNE